MLYMLTRCPFSSTEGSCSRRMEVFPDCGIARVGHALCAAGTCSPQGTIPAISIRRIRPGSSIGQPPRPR